MGMFTFKKSNPLNIQVEGKADGVFITVLKDDQSVSLPVRLTIKELKRMDNVETVQLIEDLWYDGKIVENQGRYVLSHEGVYDLNSAERSLLGLPSHPTPLTIQVDNDSFVGSKQFKLKAIYATNDIPNLHRIGIRHGSFIELPSGEKILLPKEQYLFLELVDHTPSPEDTDQLFYHIAKVKKEAKKHGFTISEHIARENYEFIESVDLQVEGDVTGLRLIPQYQHDELEEGVLQDERLHASGYTKHKNSRVFVDRKAKESADTITNIGPIEGEDIPRFVQNPEAYIPEEVAFSREAFGERVKSLGIRVYHASPYIHANQSENGWFDFDCGFHVKDEEGNAISVEEDRFFSGEEESSFKQVDDHTFVTVPPEAEMFQQYTNKLKNEDPKSPSAKLHTSNYILEIFENIQHVEYNQPLHEMRESLKDQHVLDKLPPARFQATLHPFQESGFVWMKSLWFAGYGGLLADDMGLGKTIQVIAYLSYLKEQNKLTPTLLVLPKSLIDNWINEIEKFAPHMAKGCYVHLNQGRLKDPKAIRSYDIVLTTYQTLARDQLILGQIDWQMVIGDEAQAIKNPTTGVSIVMKALKNKGRLALTGTPVENNLTELWSIVDFVQPGLLGSLKEFKDRYEKPLKKEGADYDEIQKEIEDHIQFIYKRRTKAGELKDQLPQKLEHHGESEVSLGKEQKEMYESIIAQVKNKEIPSIDGIRQLKMLCSHPGLLDPSLRSLKPKEVPKLEQTIHLLKMIKSEGEKALIFSEYREMQSILKLAIANNFNINSTVINGSTQSRQQLVDHFNGNEGFDVMILSPKAAGTGLTITSANHVIHYTRWWNPAVENQATDRAYRIGQKKDVHVYYPLVIDEGVGRTVEEVVDDLLMKKKALAENVIVPSRDLETEEILDGII